MAVKENQRVTLTKKLLKDSLIRMLKDVSIYKISIRELCENANINRSTFYKYYGSQYELLAEMEKDMLFYIQENLAGCRNNGGPDEKAIVLLLDYIEKNDEMCRLLINNNIDPEFPRKLLQLPEIRETLHSFLSEKYPGEYSEYVFTFLIQGAYNVVIEWINKERREPAERIAALISEMIKNAVAHL